VVLLERSFPLKIKKAKMKMHLEKNLKRELKCSKKNTQGDLPFAEFLGS